MSLEAMMMVYAYALKVSQVSWLRASGNNGEQPLALSDFRKRTEIFSELIYYIFDSFLIPLIRTNFHVTESSVHRHRLFFFRHDAWRRLTEPAFARLKHSIMEELKPEAARTILDGRALGFSQIRLLPKDTGMRSIINLRRRSQKLHNGRMVLGRSINSTVAPAFHVLNFEKVSHNSRRRHHALHLLTIPQSNHRAKLGSSLFSIGDMYGKLRTFRKALQESGATTNRLYFAKVDVTSCFDTLPQDMLVKLAEDIMSAKEYHIARHAEVKPAEEVGKNRTSSSIRPRKAYRSVATDSITFETFEQTLTRQVKLPKPHAIFNDAVVRQSLKKQSILDLLKDHITENIVRIGKKFFRQKRGIAQGSVLSSLLCNIGYAAFEEKYLGFVNDRGSLLLRLVDDFLLITASKAKATRFLQIMHNGNAAHGISIKPEKSLANFDVEIDGEGVPRCSDPRNFPYCKMQINCDTLDITKEQGLHQKERSMFFRDVAKRGRLIFIDVTDTLTVEYSRLPGLSFRRKMTRFAGLLQHRKRMCLIKFHL